MANHPNRAPRSGHLPGHIRGTFLAAIDAYINTEDGQPLPLVSYEIQYRERLISVAEACRLVWNCADILPGQIVSELRDCLMQPPQSGTYAAAGQALLFELQRHGLVDSEADISRRRRYDDSDAAWRDIEGWLANSSAVQNRLSPDHRQDPREAARILRGMAYGLAEHLVAQARDGKSTDSEPLDELVRRVIAAEDAVADLGG